ncbi:binding partner of ACD11 1-like [Tasmannia lanceolata]|uniref:binding partner of ACD11 1-like n=1 Tax=Tasmannia lanceolata TaxID=3420 RepID=UPI00406490A5
MGTLDLTIQVLDLSPKITVSDLTTFFSYCGTIEDITLHRNGDQSRSAFVTFRQPYAQKTALLLNGATIVDSQVRILPLPNLVEIPISSSTSENMNSDAHNKKVCLITKAQTAVRTMSSKGQEALQRAKELEQKYEVSETGRALSEQAKLAIITAEKTVEHAGSVVVNSDYFSGGALWLSGVFDNAAKCTAELANKVRQMKSKTQK